MPKNPNTQEPLSSSTIKKSSTEVSNETKNFYGNLVDKNTVMAHRHNSRMFNSLGIENNNVTDGTFLNILDSDPTLKGYIADSALAYYHKLSGGKPISKHTLDRLTNGTLLV